MELVENSQVKLASPPEKYPGKWIKGKIRGFLHKSDSRWRAHITIDKKKHSKSFNFGQKSLISEDAAIEEAYKWLVKVNLEHNLTKNDYRFIDQQTIEVKLNLERTMLTDSKFLPYVKKYVLYYRPDEDREYAMASMEGNVQKNFHTLICPEWKVVDHVNGNGLDNRMSNLRDGSGNVNANNARLLITNKTGVNGVSERKDKPAYKVTYRVNGKCLSKNFSVFKYGSKENALKAAVQFRKERDIESGCTNGIRPKRKIGDI